MIAFDSDVLTGILAGNVELVERAKRIPKDEQSVPIIVVEEMVRGRLSIIRRSEAGKHRVSLSRAYDLFMDTFNNLSVQFWG